MKNTIITSLLIFVGIQVLAQTSICERNTNFGEVEICLPKFENYKECYPDSIIKIIADATEAPTNIVLGFYLNNETYSQIDSLDQFDDYFKIYGTKEVKDLRFNKKMLHEMKAHFGGIFNSLEWNMIQDQLKQITNEIEIGKPISIKNYSHNEQSFTYVVLTKFQLNNEESYTMAMTINGLLLNDRLVWMAYYLDYEGEESLEEVQKKSNMIIEQMVKSNE